MADRTLALEAPVTAALGLSRVWGYDTFGGTRSSLEGEALDYGGTWDQNLAAWSTANGIATAAGATYTTFQDGRGHKWTKLEVTVNPASTGNGVGILMGFVSTSNHMEAYIDGDGDFVVRQVVGGTATTLLSFSRPNTDILDAASLRMFVTRTRRGTNYTYGVGIVELGLFTSITTHHATFDADLPGGITAFTSGSMVNDFIAYN